MPTSRKLKGNRTKLTGAVLAAVVALDARFGWGVPVEVYSLLVWLVIYFLRDALPKRQDGALDLITGGQTGVAK